MTKLVCAPAPPATEPTAADDADVLDDDELIEDDLLLEDVSIDGMCGVY